jgi:VWFA-related protein
MIRVGLRSLAPVALVLVAAAPAPLALGQEGSDLPGVFGEVIEVRVINLEVVVTDKHRERVSGLGPESFRLLVDGEPVPIEFFTEIRDGVAMSSPGVEVGMELAPGTEPGVPVQTSYLLFLDEYFSIKQDRDYVLDEMIDQIAGLAPQDRVAVVAFDGNELDMLSSWTGSVDELQDVLEQAKERPAYGLQRLSERNRFDDSGQIALVGEFLRYDERQISLDTYLTPEERFYASMLAGQVERAVQAAAATLRSFAQPAGRKVMLLASGGWPYLPADFVVSDLRRPVWDARVSGGGELFRPLTETANRLGYTIYGIDVPGIDPGTSDIGEPLADDTARAAGLIDPRGIGGRGASFVREQEIQYTLEFIAGETGGRALLNSARADAFETARTDTRSYYWLGFTPSWQGDDRYHEVKIELTDPSLRIRNRDGFLDISRVEETSMQVESSLLFGNPPSTDPLKLSFGRPEKTGMRKMNVPLEVEIPLDKVVFLPTAEGFGASLELRVAVIDSKGARAEIPVVPLLIKGPREPEPGAVYTYQTLLKMRRDEHRAVVAIYDQASGNILSGTAEVSP